MSALPPSPKEICPHRSYTGFEPRQVCHARGFPQISNPFWGKIRWGPEEGVIGYSSACPWVVRDARYRNAEVGENGLERLLHEYYMAAAR
jgi:hypothetical protein